jgi:two-component system OmpR family sensor kinase
MRRALAGTRLRLTMAFAAVLLVAIVVADVALYVALSRTETSAAADVLISQAHTIASGIEDVNGQVRFGSGDLPTETTQGVAVDAAIVASSGSIIATTTQALSPATLAQIAADASRLSTPASPFLTRDSHGVSRLVYAESLQTGQGSTAVLVVSRSIGELEAALGQTILFIAILSVLIIVAGTLLAHRLAGGILSPVRTIASTARSLSQHDLHRRVQVEVTPDELGELVETFNGMLARLESSFESLRRFTADASHELRSPLTVMRSEIEGTLARPRSSVQYQEVLRGLEAEVEHMARTVDQLLMLARADAGALTPASRNLDVADFLHETAARWRPLATPRRVQIEVNAPDSGTVSADPDLLRRLIDNLIDNAIRHAPSDSAVRLTGTETAGGWQIDVHDDGPGIPASARATLFERFVRLDGARARESGGAGLGLALSRAIAQAHGASLQLVEPNGAGATFRLSLPGRHRPGSSPASTQ